MLVCFLVMNSKRCKMITFISQASPKGRDLFVLLLTLTEPFVNYPQRYTRTETFHDNLTLPKSTEKF